MSSSTSITSYLKHGRSLQLGHIHIFLFRTVIIRRQIIIITDKSSRPNQFSWQLQIWQTKLWAEQLTRLWLRWSLLGTHMISPSSSYWLRFGSAEKDKYFSMYPNEICLIMAIFYEYLQQQWICLTCSKLRFGLLINDERQPLKVRVRSTFASFLIISSISVWLKV